MMQTELIKTIRTLSPPDNVIPAEYIVKNMIDLEQFAESVVNYTSKYNIDIIMSYSPDNLAGSYVKYPSYGDFPETYQLRTYGKWWSESEAFQEEYRPQDVDPLGAEDYVTLRFQSAVLPRHVCIYETYNPGAVIRIWGRHSNYKRWKLLWEGQPQICPEESRKFRPEIRQLNCLINEIRLEFNQSHLKYHTSIDAVLLGGYQPKLCLLYGVLERDLLSWTSSKNEFEAEDAAKSIIRKQSGLPRECESDLITTYLPYEIITHIFQYLDLMSLSRCAQVNKTWHAVAMDPILYQNICLKWYWNRVDHDTLNLLSYRCRGLKKLDLSWCGNDSTQFADAFISFLQKCCKQLTHLSLCHCEFVTNNILKEIAVICHELVDLRLRNTRADTGYKHLSELNKVIALDVSLTKISDDSLLAILKANPNLKHVNVDLCGSLKELDQVIEMATRYTRNLTTWSSWKNTSVSSIGASQFGKFPDLKELDLGWCLMVSHPADSLEKIANGCRKLKRLIISQWRGVTEQMLWPVIRNCRDLTQLDLLGINGITNDFCEMVFISLPNLKLLDISFCSLISNEKIELWRQQYPHVTIQRSCRFETTDYLN